MTTRTPDTLRETLQQDLQKIEKNQKERPFILLGADITPQQIGIQPTTEIPNIGLPNEAKIFATETPNVYVLEEVVSGKTHHTILTQNEPPRKSDFI